MQRILVTVVLVLAMSGLAQAQVGNLIWEDNFNNLENWLKVTGNGYWGWGNGELEYYLNENVDIADVPGETGNKALRIIAKQESGPGIVDQWGNPLSYTSGKVVSKSFVSVKYGMIEVRAWMPSLDLGGWPAVWLLGTANYAWPRCGEIDMMEMGLKKAFRDLHDTHNGGNGLDNSTVNQMVGANTIYYSDAAVTPENPSGAASLAWDPDDDYCRPYYNYSNPLNGRFLTYRLYWDANSLRQTVIDGGVEYDLFADPFTIAADGLEFREPFYLVANLAIGGAVTDAYQLGAPGSGLPVTMPFPATMYVDYIRVYQWNGQGEVALGPPTPQGGTFGLFTDTTPTDGGLVTDVTSRHLRLGEHAGPRHHPAVRGAERPLVADQRQGVVRRRHHVDPAAEPVRLRRRQPQVQDQDPRQRDLQDRHHRLLGQPVLRHLPRQPTQYGLVRNGEWGQASIPVSDLRGTAIDLRMLSYAFVILEEQGIACEFALDDIYWDGGTPVAVGDPGDARAGRHAARHRCRTRSPRAPSCASTCRRPAPTKSTSSTRPASG